MLVLVSTLLNGSNYHGWSRVMRMSPLSKSKLKFVDGTIVMPDPDALSIHFGSAATRGPLMANAISGSINHISINHIEHDLDGQNV